jgi:hypothetical protein
MYLLKTTLYTITTVKEDGYVTWLCFLRSDSTSKLNVQRPLKYLHHILYSRHIPKIWIITITHFQC